MSVILNIVIFVLILSFLVIIHELGHYLMAKKVGVIVEEFGLGYPPRALKLFKKWGTVFSLNWIPFGGFVKMKGEFAQEGEPPKNAKAQIGSFVEQSAAARLAIILAGAAVNFLYGVLAFSVVFSFTGIPALEPVVTEVEIGSPAANAGMPSQVKITQISINDEVLSPTTYPQVSDFLRKHPGETVTLQVVGPCQQEECGNRISEYTVPLRPQAEVSDEHGPLGVSFQTRMFYPWYQMPIRGAAYGVSQALYLGYAIVQGLGTMVTDLITKGQVPADVTGPVGIAHEAQANKLFEQGIGYTVLFSGLISINLAVMNVLPIPALDGGRALFIILEKILGKKRVSQVEGYATYGGFVILIILISLVTLRDVLRIVRP